MIATPVLLLACLLLLVAGTRELEERVPIIQKISSAVVCTLVGILLANIGLIPRGGEFMDQLSRYAIPYAIVLFVLSTRLADLKKAGPRMVLGFLLAGFGTFVGAFAASLLFAGVLGPETWKLGGTFAGAFFGGGLNFAAVGRGLDMTESLFAGAFVVDNLSTVPWMLAQVGLASALGALFARRAVRTGKPESDGTMDASALRRTWTEGNLSITHLAVLSALPLLALAAAGLFARVFPGVPEVLWLTTIALALGQIPAIGRLRGSGMLSYFALHLFFILIGAASDVREVLAAGPWLFLYMILIIAIHAFVVYGIGWLARFELPTITLASQAAIGGPGSALALGMALQWKERIAPAVIVGIFGYGIGNYLGFSTAWLLRSIL